MTALRSLLCSLLEDNWTLEDGASFVADDAVHPIDGDKPLIKVYPIASPARSKSLGAAHREVRHRLTIDIRSRSLINAEAARAEAVRVLEVHQVAPWEGYDKLDFDDGSYHGGGPGLSVWTIEVTVMQYRRAVSSGA